MATMVEQDKGLTLTMTRVIKAKRERVFDAWLRPEMIREWFGAPYRSVVDVKTDVHVGGRYEIAMSAKTLPEGSTDDCGVNPSDAPTAVRGEYLEISPYDRLRFTWRGEWAPAEETLVTISLRDVDGGTELKLEHTRFQTEASMAGHEQGWNYGLAKLVRLCEA